MRVSDCYPSNYLKASDLRGTNVRVVMRRVEMERLGDDEKPILYFQGKEKGLVLNKTNANNVAMLYGDDMDEWAGREIVLFPTMVDFQGRTVEAIRVRGLMAKDRKADSSGSIPRPAGDDVMDNITPSQGARIETQARGPKYAKQVAAQSGDMSDEIPF